MTDLLRDLPAPWPFPAVRILRGSVVEHVVWGVTRRHAARRAQHKLNDLRRGGA